MGDGEDNVGRVSEPVFRVCASQIHEVGGHYHNLFNRSSPDDLVYRSYQQVCPPHAEYVVREDEVFLWEYLEVLGVISLTFALEYSHQFYINQ